MGKLYVIGIGPGGLQHMTLKAIKAIEESQVIVGYNKYIDFIKPLLEGKELYSTGMKGEEVRCIEALKQAENKIVSIISTGDSGMYGMAGLILQLNEQNNVEVEVIPGVTASCAAASVVGAPLMHDNCNISLSDLMTPYDLIKKRVSLAAEGDFVISFYNPRSIGRPHHLRECIDLIAVHRKETTPVAVVKNALRDGQEVRLFTLGTFEENVVDMISIVIIGNSQSYIKDGKFITPRGYSSSRKEK